MPAQSAPDFAVEAETWYRRAMADRAEVDQLKRKIEDQENLLNLYREQNDIKLAQANRIGSLEAELAQCRAQAIEQAAQIADRFEAMDDYPSGDLAKAIRALKEGK